MKFKTKQELLVALMKYKKLYSYNDKWYLEYDEDSKYDLPFAFKKIINDWKEPNVYVINFESEHNTFDFGQLRYLLEYEYFTKKLPELKDKDLVQVWDNNTFGKDLRFYDKKNRRCFDLYGNRNGSKYHNYKKYTGRIPKSYDASKLKDKED